MNKIKMTQLIDGFYMRQRLDVNEDCDHGYCVGIVLEAEKGAELKEGSEYPKQKHIWIYVNSLEDREALDTVLDMTMTGRIQVIDDN